MWYADGRSNDPNPGRHSLGTKEKQEALRLLVELDRVRAEDLGLVPRSEEKKSLTRLLPLGEGRKLYEKYIGRPRVAGGVKESTKKRYRASFDKFILFANTCGVTAWNQVTTKTLTDFAGDMEENGYANKSQVNDLTTIKQAINWMIEEGHFQETKPIKMKLRSAESESPYCYRVEEIKAMIELCPIDGSRGWLGDIITGFACTGLRISELAELRWSDIDFDNGQLRLTDETGYRARSNSKRRDLKSGRSRTFPINPDLLVVLNRISKSGARVFCGPRGGRLKADRVRPIFVTEIIEPLSKRFPSPGDEKGFCDARFHSFRHAFCSICANSGVPERVVMAWLGHADSKMIRHYYHLHDEESKRQMNKLDFLGGAGGRSADDAEEKPNGEDAEPPTSEEAEGS